MNWLDEIEKRADEAKKVIHDINMGSVAAIADDYLEDVPKLIEALRIAMGALEYVFERCEETRKEAPAEPGYPRVAIQSETRKALTQIRSLGSDEVAELGAKE